MGVWGFRLQRSDGFRVDVEGFRLRSEGWGVDWGLGLAPGGGGLRSGFRI